MRLATALCKNLPTENIQR